MAKFLDKKQRVIDFQLTPYGKHRLSVGRLKPAYYAFFDTGVMYDSNYAGFEEVQTKIHERIKDETQFLEGILSFEEAENSVPPGGYQGGDSDSAAALIMPLYNPDTGMFTGDIAIEVGTAAYDVINELVEYVRGTFGSPDAEERRLAEINRVRTEALALGILSDAQSAALSTDNIYTEWSLLTARTQNKTISLFDLDIIPEQHVPKPNILSFESSIGDARFEGENTQAAPAFKLLTCQGEINSVKEKDTSKYDFSIAEKDNEVKQFNIPQIDITTNYTLEISSPSGFLTEETPSDFFLETAQFADGNTIKLKKNDVVLYAEEVNTELLTENFEVEVFEMIEDAGVAVKATGTLSLATPGELQVGDTLTIDDGNTSVVFEIVDNTKTDIARAKGFLPGRVGVIKSTEYKIGGSSTDSGGVSYNRKGTIYNLISAIRQDSGDTYLGYPTPSLAGTKSDGTLDYTAGRCRRGRDAPVGCYAGRHNLKVSLPTSAINDLIDHSFAGGGYDFIITNENTTVGDINTLIQSDADTRIITTGFAGGYVTEGTELKRKYFADSVEQIVNGYMISANEAQIENPSVTQNSVEYYFNLLTDDQVSAKIACSCASTFNRDSYYIDIDFNCIDELEDDARQQVYYDIYGSATAPEICNLPSVAQENEFDTLIPDTDDECEDNQ